jgi:hypothetical protein
MSLSDLAIYRSLRANVAKASYVPHSQCHVPERSANRFAFARRAQTAPLLQAQEFFSSYLPIGY